MSRQVSLPSTIATVCVKSNAGPPVFVDVRKRWIATLVNEALSHNGLVRGTESQGVVVFHEICEGSQHRFLHDVIDNGPVKWARLTDVSAFLDSNTEATWIGGTNNVMHAGDLQTIVKYERTTFLAPPPTVWKENLGALMWCYGQSNSCQFD